MCVRFSSHYARWTKLLYRRKRRRRRRRRRRCVNLFSDNTWWLWIAVYLFCKNPRTPSPKFLVPHWFQRKDDVMMESDRIGVDKYKSRNWNSEVAYFKSFVMNNTAFVNVFFNSQKSFHTLLGCSSLNKRGYQSFL